MLGNIRGLLPAGNVTEHFALDTGTQGCVEPLVSWRGWDVRRR